MDPDGAAMRTHNGGHDGQAQAAASCFPGAGGVRAVETFKDPGSLTVWNARPMVTDFKNSTRRPVLSWAHAHGELDRGAFRCVPQGIADQVSHDLAELGLISENGGRCGVPAVEADQGDAAV